ncbi:MAG TPA: hypothetical protein VLB32_08695 [Candidatus Acidoferrales bacterium]|nr:hypothetical protein [Candidatus Acidoferrales bacterium]
MAAPPPEERALLESIRSGKASSNVKRQASRGVFPVSADEQLELLVFLTQDADPTCSQAARETLAGWTAEKCLPLLAQPDCAADVLAYFASQPEVPQAMRDAIAAHAHADDAALAPLVPKLSLEQIQAILVNEERLEGLNGFIAAVLQRADLPADLRARLEELKQKHDIAQQELEAALAREEEAEAMAAEREKAERISLTQKIARMSVSERIQAALKGDKDTRMILIRDPAKVVYRAVLQSPKLSDAEIENFATMKNVADEALRIIANSRKFMKNYVVARNLLNNPRTPLDVSLTLLNRMTVNDLKNIGKNRNIPETLRANAVKLFKQRSETRKSGG